MDVNDIMAQLQAMGSSSIKKLLLKHGVKEPFFGVKIADLKPIQKKIKKDYRLAKDLYATGNADAMYLAGLIADDEAMTRTDLQTWVEEATSQNISEHTVPWVATGSHYGFELALEWIDNPEERIAAAGWATLGDTVSLKPDSELDMDALKGLLHRVQATIHNSPNRVKLTMNGFVIAVGSYVPALTSHAVATAKTFSDVTVDMGDTACKLPVAIDYIKKAQDKGTLGKKKKTVKC